MAIRWGRFSLEISFVISVMIILKAWVFPFFISIWFPTSELSSLMHDWTGIIVGIVIGFIYIGFGSSAKYHHQFSLFEAIIFFLCLHMVMLPLGFEIFRNFSIQWSHLLGDLIALFAPASHMGEWQLFLIYLFLFLLGRSIRVDEKQIERAEAERLFVQKLGKTE